jgi:type 1 glutamine amidotransferase
MLQRIFIAAFLSMAFGFLLAAPRIPSALGGAGDALPQKDARLRVLIAIAEPEYDTKTTLPTFAKKVLAEQLGLEVIIIQGDNKKMELPGFAEALPKADLVLLSIRRLAPLPQDLEALKKYLDSGKPLIGIRTACHAFDAKGAFPAGHAEWVKFDPEVLGGNYHNHHKDGIPVTIGKAAKNAPVKAFVHPILEGQHPILTGIKLPFKSEGSLYKTSPLLSTTELLLMGSIPNQDPEPVAWTNQYKKARIFFTSLGHPSDFDNPQFVQLLRNAALWCLDKEIDKK